MKSLYDEQVSERILYSIEHGESLRHACELANVNKGTFLGWMKVRPLLRAAYNSAQMARNDSKRAEIAELQRQIDHLEAQIPKRRFPGEPKASFHHRRRFIKSRLADDLRLLRLRRDELKWNLGRMTARALMG